MAEPMWLDGYSGQTVDELIGLSDTHRIDSLVLAVEQGLLRRAGEEGLAALNEVEVTVLAVEALEREVNNGGYYQFLVNAPEFAPVAVAALSRIGCGATAEITARALSLTGSGPPFAAGDGETAHAGGAEDEWMDLLVERCDGPFYETGEPIADRLFEYVRANRRSIRLP